MKTNVLLLRNKIRLEQMIKNNKSKAEIVAQSKRLDKYILEEFKIMNHIIKSVKYGILRKLTF